MQKLTFKNTRGQSIELGRSYPYLLGSLTGIGAPPSAQLVQQGFHQDGVNAYGSLLKPRIIDIQLYVGGGSRAQDRFSST